MTRESGKIHAVDWAMRKELARKEQALVGKMLAGVEAFVRHTSTRTRLMLINGR
jgi:hypothetical protein